MLDQLDALSPPEAPDQMTSTPPPGHEPPPPSHEGAAQTDGNFPLVIGNKRLVESCRLFLPKEQRILRTQDLNQKATTTPRASTALPHNCCADVPNRRADICSFGMPTSG